ncbi:MAG: NAD-dependent dehydrogenase subunit [Gemmataceae bacterium]|nr:NAD-dependent dehydrogenase subunit [Gemmataceae bacterium]
MTGLLDAAFVLLILTTLVLLGSSRIRLGIRVLAVQGVVVGAAALLLPNHHVTLRVVVIVLIGTILDAVVFPILLLRALRTARVERETDPPVGYTASILIGVGLLTACLWGMKYGGITLPHEGANPLELPVAAYTVLAGLFLIVARNNALNQILGYLMLENGIFLAGLSTAMEVPLLIEMGILLDVFIMVMVMGVALFHISRTFDSIEVGGMTALTDWPDQEDVGK